MNEKTYRRMTQKRPLRGFKLFIAKYFNRHRFYALCAKMKLVREVTVNHREMIINNDTLNRVRCLKEKLVTDRGSFSLSYFAEGYKYTNQWYYESLFRQKRLFTEVDSITRTIIVQVRAECEEWECRFNPLTYVKVAKRHSKVSIPIRKHDPNWCYKELPFVTVETTEKTIDFLNARFKAEMSQCVDEATGVKTIEDAIKVSLQRIRSHIDNFLRENTADINERLTGVKNDGEFLSPTNQKLIPNTTCRCGIPVFFSEEGADKAWCPHHSTISIRQTRKVDPEIYKDCYENTKRLVFNILSDLKEE